MNGFEGVVGSRFADRLTGDGARQPARGPGRRRHPRRAAAATTTCSRDPGTTPSRAEPASTTRSTGTPTAGSRRASSRAARPARGSTSYTSIEGLGGSDYADVLTGNGGRNGLYGYDGNDRLLGKRRQRLDLRRPGRTASTAAPATTSCTAEKGSRHVRERRAEAQLPVAAPDDDGGVTRAPSPSRRPTAPRAPGLCAPRTATFRRRPSCPSGRRRPSRASIPDRVRELGASIVLANTYHLVFRPGRRARSRSSAACTASWAGTGRSSPTRAASRSSRCATRSRGADDDGVTFRSVYDGDLARFTPELAADVQRRLGSDIAMALDVCLPAGASRAELARGGRADDRLGEPPARGAAEPRASSSSGSRRAASTPSFAAARSRRSSTLGFDGYALGGLSVGENRETMLETLETAAPQLPADRARYFMGIGDPAGHPRRDRARDRHVRLRPADPARPSGDGVHARRDG